MTRLTNRVISIYDRKTTMRLATAEWHVLDNICYLESMKRKHLLELIDQNRDKKIGFTPAVRLFSLLYLDGLSAKLKPHYGPIDNHKHLNDILQKLNL